MSKDIKHFRGQLGAIHQFLTLVVFFFILEGNQNSHYKILSKSINRTTSRYLSQISIQTRQDVPNFSAIEAGQDNKSSYQYLDNSIG